MRGTNYHLAKVEKWKGKAKCRRLENERLKRRLEEVLSSRERWKLKYKSTKAELFALEQERKSSQELKVDKPKYHSYTTPVILLVLMLRQQGLCSLRCCSRMLLVFNLSLGLELSTPCANTIRNWEAKHGLYRLSARPPKGSKWMIIIDESIGIGKQKLLLILGINLDAYEFGKAPDLKDAKVLDVSISASWKWEKMHNRIALLKQRGFDIKYGVSDGGASVVKSLAESAIHRVADCTHVFGNLLKKRYSKSEAFLSYCRFCKQLKRQVLMGKNTAIMPPTQRTKGKYLNIFPLVEWGEKMLSLLSSQQHLLTAVQIEKLTPLFNHESLIKEMSELCKTLKKLSAVLKNDGLSTASRSVCQDIISQPEIATEVRQGVLNYLMDNCISIDKCKRLICSSDIIESTFGKYKRSLSNTAKSQINDSCLFIANYSENFSLEETKQAMEQVRIVDLAKWKEENTVVSLTKQKQALLKNVG